MTNREKKRGSDSIPVEAVAFTLCGGRGGGGVVAARGVVGIPLCVSAFTELHLVRKPMQQQPHTHAPPRGTLMN